MRIPYKLVEGILLVEAEIDGRKDRMAFDTGAVQICLNSKYLY